MNSKTKIEPDLSDQGAWTFKSRGEYSRRHDYRGLATISYPSAGSRAGNFAELRRRIELPRELKSGRCYLRFYVSDDYIGGMEILARADKQLGLKRDFKKGCRFLQVLVDDAVVWEQDVFGRTPRNIKERFRIVDVSGRVRGKKRVTLRLRVCDRRGTRDKFAVNVYWAFLALAGSRRELENPQRYIAFLPRAGVKSESAARRSGEVPLSVELDVPLPSCGYPVGGGIPFQEGVLKSERNVKLLDAERRERPCQTAVLGKWRDGSIRWLLVEFQMRPGEKRYSLVYGKNVRRKIGSKQLSLRKRGGKYLVSTGRLDAVIDAEDSLPWESLGIRGETIVGACGSTISDGLGKGHVHRLDKPDTVMVEEEGPQRVTIKKEGWYVSGARRIFKYSFRVSFFAGQDFVRVSHRFENRDRSVKLADMGDTKLFFGDELFGYVPMTGIAMEMPLAFTAKEAFFDSSLKRGTCIPVPAEGRAEAVQTEDNCVSISNGKGRGLRREGKLAGYVETRGARHGAMAAVRNLWQQFPKSFSVESGRIGIGLWPRGAAPFRCAQGVAKEHTFFVRPFVRGRFESAESDNASYAALFQREPLLMASPEWYCRCGVFGDCVPIDANHNTVFVKGVRHALDCQERQREEFSGYGMENFGDISIFWGYGKRSRFWGNCEYDIPRSLLLLAAVTGDRRCFRLGAEAARHYMDVDIIHSLPRQQPRKWYLERGIRTLPADWLGGPHHHTRSHTQDAASPSHAWVQGLLDYYHLTGDRNAVAVLGEVTDYFLRVERDKLYRSQADVDEYRYPESRDIGWPVIGLIGLYEATDEDKYLRATTRMVREAIKRSDPIRGAWMCPYGPREHGGAGWGWGILMDALIMYHRVTGDADAAALIVKLADYVIVEEIGWLSDGKRGKKVNPHAAQVMSGIIYSYLLTGRSIYREIAARMLRGYRRIAGRLTFMYHVREIPRALYLAEKAGL